MLCGIYARKRGDDSDKNEEARSTTRQIERATAYAQSTGWTVDLRYVYVDDAVSGAEWKHRPGWNALIAALEPRPPFGVVVVSELSRIGRDTVRTPAAVMQLEEAGVEVRSYLGDAPISLADESSEIHTIFNSLAASFERRRARQRTYDALRRRAEAGATRLPSIYANREFVDAGGLMAYGTSAGAQWRRVATYVHRILQGAKPGDLPVEQPTKLELVINLKTAKALGIRIPQSILVRADQVIE